MKNTDAIRRTCDALGRRTHVEMSNVSLRQIWPAVAKLIEANAFDSAEMRGLALETFVDSLVKESAKCGNGSTPPTNGSPTRNARQPPSSRRCLRSADDDAGGESHSKWEFSQAEGYLQLPADLAETVFIEQNRK
jgi:hypothetical protein